MSRLRHNLILIPLVILGLILMPFSVLYNFVCDTVEDLQDEHDHPDV